MKSAELTVVEATDADASAWNAFVESHPNGSTFHRWEWRQLYQDVYGHETPYLIARDGASIAGVLPLVRVRSLWFGHFLVSLPYVSYGGPVGGPAAERALTSALPLLARGAKLVELRSRNVLDTRLQQVQRKITVVLDVVPGSFDATFKRFDSKLRSQVRRAEREGLVVRFGHELVGDFHKVFAEHMRDLGSPAHGQQFFATLARALGSRAWVGVAYLGDVPVAGGVAVENGREVEISWASALRRYQKLAPNMALYGAFIRRTCELNFDAFNFGRCTEGSGTHKFKLQWGSRNEALPWYQLGGRTGEVGSLTPTGAGASAAVSIWRRLPLALTNPLGKMLIAGIP